MPSVTATATSASDIGGGVMPWVTGSPFSSVVNQGTIGNPATWGNSNRILLSGFGFAIPGGSVINGIVVTSVRTIGGSVTLGPGDPDPRNFLTAQLYNSGLTGTAKTVNTLWGDASANTLGGASDIWGASLSSGIVNSAGFGVALMAQFNQPAAATGAFLSLDNLQITVHYTAGSVGTGEHPMRGPTASRRIMRGFVL